jgi:hypothetical protein
MTLFLSVFGEKMMDLKLGQSAIGHKMSWIWYLVSVTGIPNVTIPYFGNRTVDKTRQECHLINANI